MIKRILLFLTIMLLPALYLTAEEKKTADWYEQRADEAIAAEEYEKAISLLEEGKKLYPKAVRLYQTAGDLYSEKKLYRMALNEYREAETIDPGNSNIHFNLAQTYGFLNENEESVYYFEKLLEDPDYSSLIINDLAWMYFKTHRHRQGEALLLSALEQGFNRNYAHTLGTLYAGMYDYENSRKYYLMAIEDAENISFYYFAAIAYYNLALLETSFYHYDNAMEYTRKSLENRERASGYTSQGELYTMRMDYGKAYEALSNAENMDDTPLSLFSKVDLFLNYGALNSAAVYINRIANWEDKSWMYYYGMNIQQYEKDLHYASMRLYQGLGNQTAYHISLGPLDFIKKNFRRIKYKFLTFYHKVKYRNALLNLAEEEEKQDNYYDSWWYSYQASRDYRPIALKYLKKSEAFEEKLTPLCAPWYDLEEGRVKDDSDLLKDAAGHFDPDWEKIPLCETYEEMARLYKKQGRRNETYDVLNTLYAVNPGGLLQKGFALPLIVRFRTDQSVDIKTERWEKKVYGILRRSGVPVSKNKKPGFEYILTILLYPDGNVVYSLTDKNGYEAYSGNYNLKNYKMKTLKTWLNNLIVDIHSINYEGNPVY